MKKIFIVSLLALITLSIFLACNDDPPTSSGGDDDKRAYLTITVTDTLQTPIADALVKVAGYFFTDNSLTTLIDWTDETGRLTYYPVIKGKRDTLSIWISKEGYRPDSSRVRVEYNKQMINMAFHLRPLDAPNDGGDKRANLTILIINSLHFPISDAEVRITGYFGVYGTISTVVGRTDESGLLLYSPVIRNHRDTISIWAGKEDYAPESTQVRVEHDWQTLNLSLYLKPL